MTELRHTFEAKEKFLRNIKGLHVVIPDLFALLPGWKFEINSNYETVKDKTDKWVESWVESSFLRRRTQIANFPKLAACLFPDALEEECLMMSYYHLWVFLWDDELDCGPYADNISMAMEFKKETDEALAYTLGEQPFNGHPPSMAPVMSAFSTVAEKVVAGTTADIRRRFLSELKVYVDSACLLPLLRQNNVQKDLLSVEGFLEQRKASGGCGPSVILALYVYHLNIPSSILDHEAMRTIADQACLLVHLLNDIVSFAKELKDNQMDNIVPILALEKDCTLQEAIYHACYLVREAHRTFEEATKRVPVPTGDPDLDQQIQRFIQACRDLATGFLNWSFNNERYFGKNPKREENKIFLEILSS